MGWSFRVARFGQTEVRIHVTFLLLLAFFAFTGHARGGTAGALVSLAFILALFLCVLLHEFGHALAAARYGIKTPDITLLPIGGVARLQRMPDQPVQELVVALAGPLVNVVIAAGLFLGGLGRWTGWRGMADVDNPYADFLGTLMTVNIWLVVFNLIPAFPMDGGRVLRALLATRLNYARATRIAATVGQVLAFGFAAYALVNRNPMLILIAVFIYFGAAQEAAAAQMRDFARGVAVSDAMVTDFRTLGAADTLEDAVEALLRTSQHDFPVVDDAGGVQGILTRTDMIRALREGGPSVPVASVMQRDVPSVPLGTSFERAFRIMNEHGLPAVLVRDRLGRLVGVITPENVGEMMMVQAALGDRGDGSRPSWVRRHVEQPGGLAPADVPLPGTADGAR
jgi:Zn-dependent protease/CBS domain-containing protein